MSELKKIQQEELQNVAGGGCGEKRVTKWRIKCNSCRNYVITDCDTKRKAVMDSRNHPCRLYHACELESYEVLIKK